MYLNDLPQWLLNRLVPALPWLWVVVCVLGLALVLSRWLRWRSKTPACPVCRYDMRGSPGLTCPECGHSVTKPEHLLRRHPRRRWATVLGLLMLLGGPHVDLVQYRLQQGETLQRAAVPTTVWLIGYPWWPRSTEEVMRYRVFNETLRRMPASGIIRQPLPRSEILKYVFRQTEQVGYHESPLPHWQTRLAARRGYTSMRALQRRGMTTPYGHVIYYLSLSESVTDDSFARDKLIEGLGSNDPHIREGCSNSIKTLGVRASPYVPLLEQRLHELLIRGKLDHANFRPKLYGSDVQALYDTMVESIETAIGNAGPAGIAVADDWLGSDDEVLRESALRIVTHNADASHYSPEFVEQLVDILTHRAWHHRYQNTVSEIGLLAVSRAHYYLTSESPATRAEAMRLLGIVFFDGPRRRLASALRQFRNPDQCYEEWAVRVDDPVYRQVVADVSALAETETDELVRERIQRFLEKHERLGTSEQRRRVIQMQDPESAQLMYEWFK